MFFEKVLEAKPDPVFGFLGLYRADSRPEKVNLVVGVYCDEALKTSLIPAVKKAKEEVFEQGEDLLADYLAIEGDKLFCEEVGALAFGELLWKKHHSQIAAIQTPGGTGALRLGADFLAREVGKVIFLPDPTWPNHINIFKGAGLQIESYPYYSSKKRALDREALFSFLEEQSPGSIVLFHATCHNPSGSDPNEEDWKALSKLCKKKQLFPFFDFAYQGFGDGLSEDRKAISIFLEDGHEMAIAYSCSKNFSLYCQRMGALFVVTSEAEAGKRVLSSLKPLVRSSYSNPPAHGAKVVSHLLRSSSLKKEWEKELGQMRGRLQTIRKRFVDMLQQEGDADFSYLLDHKGMFSFLDLQRDEAIRLREEMGVYLLDSGRINVAGLNEKNLPYVVQSILKVRLAARRG